MWMLIVGRAKASGVATIAVERTMRVIGGMMKVVIDVVVDPSGTTSGMAIVSACRRKLRIERRLVCAADATGGRAVCGSRRPGLWKRPLCRRHRPAKQAHCVPIAAAAFVTATWLLLASIAAAILCAVVASSPASSVFTVAAAIAPPSALASSSQLRSPSLPTATRLLSVVMVMVSMTIMGSVFATAVAAVFDVLALRRTLGGGSPE